MPMSEEDRSLCVAANYPAFQQIKNKLYWYTVKAPVFAGSTLEPRRADAELTDSDGMALKLEDARILVQLKDFNDRNFLTLTVRPLGTELDLCVTPEQVSEAIVHFDFKTVN